MAQSEADDLREHVKELLALAADISDSEKRWRLSSRAFSLAQRAKAIRRKDGDGQEPKPDPVFKFVAETNIWRFVGELYVEHDGKLRELYRRLALWEERWFGIKQKRSDMLARLLRDCDGRVSKLTKLLAEQRVSGVSTEDAQRLLDNVLDTQFFLRTSLRAELARSHTQF
jgi:hypothetical protein